MNNEQKLGLSFLLSSVLDGANMKKLSGVSNPNNYYWFKVELEENPEAILINSSQPDDNCDKLLKTLITRAIEDSSKYSHFSIATTNSDESLLSIVGLLLDEKRGQLLNGPQSDLDRISANFGFLMDNLQERNNEQKRTCESTPIRHALNLANVLFGYDQEYNDMNLLAFKRIITGQSIEKIIGNKDCKLNNYDDFENNLLNEQDSQSEDNSEERVLSISDFNGTGYDKPCSAMIDGKLYSFNTFEELIDYINFKLNENLAELNLNKPTGNMGVDGYPELTDEELTEYYNKLQGDTDCEYLDDGNDPDGFGCK